MNSLNVVLEQIFVEHNTDETVKYLRSASAREAFLKFSKLMENVTLSQSSAGTRPNPKVNHRNGINK